MELTRQLLNEHSEHEVNIYEKEDYPGGHTHTVEFESKLMIGLRLGPLARESS
jgi:hypothetical protein